jgi:hypothetical protein
VKFNQKDAAALIKACPELEKYRQSKGSLLCKALKALYGLATSARRWYLFITSLLAEIGYVRSIYDRALLYKFDGPSFVILCIHVDDTLIVETSAKLYSELIEFLRSRLYGFTTNTGDTLEFLSMTIEIRRDHIAVSRPMYVQKLIDKYSITTSVQSPCVGSLIKKLEADSPELPPHSLSSVIMEIRYLVEVMPIISWTVAVLTQHMSKPTFALKDAVHHLLRYIYGVQHRKICFAPDSLQLHCWVDASFGCYGNGLSHACFLITVGSPNAPAVFYSAKIKTVCRSATEAEIVAFNTAASEVLQSRNIMDELRFTQSSVPMYEDNEAALTLFDSPDLNYGRRSKHMQVKYFFVQEQIREGTLHAVQGPGEEQLADGGTKAKVGEASRFFANVYFNDQIV